MLWRGGDGLPTRATNARDNPLPDVKLGPFYWYTTFRKLYNNRLENHIFDDKLMIIFTFGEFELNSPLHDSTSPNKNHDRKCYLYGVYKVDV